MPGQEEADARYMKSAKMQFSIQGQPSGCISRGHNRLLSLCLVATICHTAAATSCEPRRIIWPLRPSPYGHYFQDSKNNPLECWHVGLAPGAEIHVDLQRKIQSTSVNKTQLVVLSRSQLEPVRQGLLFYKSQSPNSDMQRFPTTWRGEVTTHLKATIRIDASKNDLYYIILLHAAHDSDARGWIRGRISFVNPGEQNLPLQDIFLPQILRGFSVLIMVLTFAYSWLLITRWRRRRTDLHSLMTLVLFMHGGVLFVQWQAVEAQREGRGATFLVHAAECFSQVQKDLEILLFLLIALGWKYLRSGIDFTEARFVAGTGLISLYLGALEAFHRSSGMHDASESYKISRYILHCLSYFVVTIVIHYNQQVLTTQIGDWPARPEVGRLYQKKRAYSMFCWIFILFMIGQEAESNGYANMRWLTAIPWEDRHWTFILLRETRMVIIYGSLLSAFRPCRGHFRVLDMAPEVDEGISS